MRRLPAGGTQFYVVTIAPRTRVPFHTTNTYEYHCVVAGEIVCLLEVDEVTVRAGEVLIVRGSPHAWENRTDTPWMSVVSMMSAAPTA
jgi:quercetin dioxygenase-like cupin family protein